LPEALAESLLFGHERGAFTGADKRTDGAFLRAQGGTLFLDELGELPPEIQPKLLRAVAEDSVRRVGARDYERCNVRVIAATRRDLRREINAGRFRDDLYFRLAQVRVHLPPLRERLDDIPILVAEACERIRRPHTTERVTAYILSRFRNYDWPGNVRELVNVASVLASLGDDAAHDMLPVEMSPGAPTAVATPDTSQGFVQAKRDFEASYFREMLAATDGNITEISRRCGLQRHKIRAHLKKLGLT
jgi:DNA-binding NtrC family response regulator